MTEPEQQPAGGPTVTHSAKVQHAAADRRAGMTLDELAAFVQAAMRAEIPGTAHVAVDLTWRNTIRRLEIKCG